MYFGKFKYVKIYHVIIYLLILIFYYLFNINRIGKVSHITNINLICHYMLYKIWLYDKKYIGRLGKVKKYFKNLN